jgi:hypothetical protein
MANDEPPPWATNLIQEMRTLRNDMEQSMTGLEQRMTGLEQRMANLETDMRYITELTSFDTPPETHEYHHRRASANINNHFPQAGAVVRAEFDATGLSARVGAIEMLMTEAGFKLPSQK